jgi:hypothetical protein
MNYDVAHGVLPRSGMKFYVWDSIAIRSAVKPAGAFPLHGQLLIGSLD